MAFDVGEHLRSGTARPARSRDLGETSDPSDRPQESAVRAGHGDSDDIELRDVGLRVHQLRKARGLSLRSLGQSAGLSPSYISQVERGMVQPSLTALKLVSKALGVSITRFFQGDDPHDQYIVRRHQRKRLALTKPHIQYELLTPGIEGQTVEFLMVYLAPAVVEEELFSHEGEEYGLVLQGRVRIALDGVSSVLYEGDSIRFDSHVPHSVNNAGNIEAVMVWAISPPNY